jgi:hypothetical protein
LFCSFRSSILASRNRVLLDEIVDLRQQGPLGRHSELESNGSGALNATILSQTPQRVSSYLSVEMKNRNT